MPSKIYHIRVYKMRSQVGESFLTGINFDPGFAELTADFLNRHLRGAALRDKAMEEEIHLYRLEAHDIGPNGEPAGQAAFRWALPTSKDVR